MRESGPRHGRRSKPPAIGEDSRRWLLAKMLPHQYADRNEAPRVSANVVIHLPPKGGDGLPIVVSLASPLRRLAGLSCRRFRSTRSARSAFRQACLRLALHHSVLAGHGFGSCAASSAAVIVRGSTPR